MEDSYVRKDTFEETMKRIEAMMEANEARRNASEARIAALIADNNARLETYRMESEANLKVYRADSRRESESLASDIKALRDTMSDIKDSIKELNDKSGRRWTIVGSIATALATVFAAIPFIKFLKPLLGW